MLYFTYVCYTINGGAIPYYAFGAVNPPPLLTQTPYLIFDKQINKEGGGIFVLQVQNTWLYHLDVIPGVACQALKSLPLLYIRRGEGWEETFTTRAKMGLDPFIKILQYMFNFKGYLDTRKKNIYHIKVNIMFRLLDKHYYKRII